MILVWGGEIHQSGVLRQNVPVQLLADNRVAAHMHLAEGYVSRAFCIKPKEFYQPTRGPRHVSEARQLVMYLAHVEFELSLRKVARRYHRDRSTVAYACRATEDRRDDPFFDGLVSQIEDLISLRCDPVFSPIGGVEQ